MVKTKNSKKSLVALVVMAFMLIASIVMAATGAWFTDKDSADGTAVTFGTLSIKEDSVSVARKTGETESLMPGDTLTLTINYELEGSDDCGGAWVRFKITAAVGKEDLKLDDETTGAEWHYVDGVVDVATAKSEEVTISFPGADYDNAYQGASVTYSVDIEIIQAKNNSGTGQEPYTAEDAFANYVEYVETPSGDQEG